MKNGILSLRKQRMLLLIQKWKYCNLKDIEEDGNMYSNYIFHVHTRRCKHASDENDEEYIRRALQLGANEIRGYKEKVEYMKKLNELEV